MAEKQSADLAHLQAQLLDCLSDEMWDPPSAQIETSAEYREWLESFDPGMVQVAQRLVKKWGVRRGASEA